MKSPRETLPATWTGGVQFFWEFRVEVLTIFPLGDSIIAQLESL